MGSADWRHSIDPREVLDSQEVRRRVAAASRAAVRRMDAVEFLNAAGPFVEVAGGPRGSGFAAAGAAHHARFSSWGIRRTRSGTVSVAGPPGVSVASVLVTMARLDIDLETAGRTADGCRLTGALPSTSLIFAGTLAVELTLVPDGVRVDARTVVPGQLVDWGTGRRVLRELFADLRAS